MKSRNKKGQATLEYVIVLTVVILALFVVIINFAAKDANKGVGKMIGSAAEMIKNATGKLPK